jgi:PAS domain S-box-containing protein
MEATGNILFANEAWHREASWNLDDWNQSHIFDSIHEADRENVTDSFHKAMKGEAVRDLEYRAVTADGKIKWITANASRINWAGVENAIIVTARDTTKRKVAEQALEESLALLGATLDATADGILAVNMDEEITSFNEKFSEIFRIPESMLLSRKDNFVVEHVMGQMKDPEAFLKVMRKTYEQTDEEVFDILEFNDERILELCSKPQKMGGKIVGRALSFRDITRQKQQDEMIRKRNERIAALYEVAKAANETLDFEKLIDLMQKAILKITNSDSIGIYSLDEKTEVLDYIAHMGLSEGFVNATGGIKLGVGPHGTAVSDRKLLIIENLRTYPDLIRPIPMGEKDPNSGIILPLVARDKVIGMLTVGRNLGNPFSSDDFDLIVGMGSQVAAAMNNASLYSQLREREIRFQTILETSRDGITVIAPDRRIIYRNSAIDSMFGYKKEDDFSGMSADDFFSPESLSVLEDVRDRQQDGKEIGESIHFKGKRKDGGAFDGEARLGSFIENDEMYDVAIVRDVTEQNRLRFQLEQSGKLAAIGELAAGVAHEINNPIATLDMRTGLIRDILGDERENIDAPILERIEEYLDIVENQVHRCQSVTEELLSFSRSPESRMENFGVNELLRKTVNFVAGLTDKKPRFDFRLDEQLPLFFGDHGRLQQVFVNLLNNAMRAIAPRDSVTISTRSGPDGGISIEFKDTGPGIDPETKARIFDPFFTTESSSGGTGLGLSISYFIIKEMDGTIDVESSPGEGATFIVTLPAQGDLDHA